MTELQHTSAKPRRTSTKRSRTGCRTCRVRRVKCDEAPGKCKNCTSTGRSCEYDLQRLPRRVIAADTSKSIEGLVLPPELAYGLCWAMTSDERRCYSHFQHHTIPTLMGIFESPLWQRLVLQMCMSERAVYHAVVALSAVHQDSEMYGSPLPGQDLQNTWHRFALEQSGRSFTALYKRNASQDPRLKEVMLLCCLLFVLMELVRSQYDRAFAHLHAGLRILEEMMDQEQVSLVESCLMAAFETLDIQSTQYGVGGPILFQEDNSAYQAGLIFEPEWTFPSLHDARQAFDSLMNGVFRFLGKCWGLPEATIAMDYGSLHQKQLRVISQLTSFSLHFESLCAVSYGSFNRKEERAADVIRLIVRNSTLAVRTCLLRDQAALEYFTPEFAEHMSLVEEILYKFPERPSFTMDIGIIPPLYVITGWCQDFSIRWRAIEVLRLWPHREGSFDSNWVAFMALEHMKYEPVLYESQRDIVANAFEILSSERGRWFNSQRDMYSLDDALSSTKSLKDWSCVRNLLNIKGAIA